MTTRTCGRKGLLCIEERAALESDIPSCYASTDCVTKHETLEIDCARSTSPLHLPTNPRYTNLRYKYEVGQIINQTLRK